MQDLMKEKALGLLKGKAVNRVLGWKKGELAYDAEPSFFSEPETLGEMVYNAFCGSNLSKYLVGVNKEAGKTLVFLKPCDTYGLNQLLSEHRVEREKVHVVGIPCRGKLDLDKLRDKGVKGILGVKDDGKELTIESLYDLPGEFKREEVLLDKCLACKGSEHKISDELLGESQTVNKSDVDRFEEVSKLEVLSSEEKFEYWRGVLSSCIRCNACRNACPSCSCLKCVFDDAHSGVSAKANTTDFEENLFHIIRAYHVAGRCSDCGECSRVCPQRIPLHLLNRKVIKDLNSLYGEFQAGLSSSEDEGNLSPLMRFDLNDVEPNIITKGGKGK